jgi:para-nitrobenzyl esterase
MTFRLLNGAAMLALGVAAIPSAAAEATPAPVRIDTGLLVGVPGRSQDITVYKGIPYAAPPVGKLRWQAPQPARPWRGVRKADRFGDLCPQLTREPIARPMSEDCLTANIWTGARSRNERRPVFVWIYGGGFSQGAGSSPQFDGEGLARKGLVVVTFNYRLGPLGFLATPELSKESGHNASGNYGILDDIALLKWVQRNVAAFGGDPGRVTIAGQSAGAGSVGFLSISPLAKGLFHRSIAQSHARHPGDPELRYLSTSWRPLKGAEEAGARYAAARGATSLAAMRALPWQKLIEGSDLIDADVYTGSSARPPLFRPVVDGWVIPRGYRKTFSHGAQNPVPYVAGSNLDETGAVPATAFAALRARTAPPRPGMPQTNVTLAAYRDWAKTKFGPMADEFLRLYPANNDDEAALANNGAARDNSRISTWLWGIEWRRTAQTPVFTYFWTHAVPGPSHDLRGAYHGSEINYVLDNLYTIDLPWTEQDRRIADIMSSYWANIAAKGDPNGPGLPVWPAHDPASPMVMEVGDHFRPIPIASPEKIDFWKRFFSGQQAW